MTFTYAVIASGGIVLVADTQMTHTHSDNLGVVGTYKGRRSKIAQIGARFAFSVAGNGGLADTLLAKVDRRTVDALPSFEQVVERYQEPMAAELDRLYRGEIPPALRETAFLFCGYVPGYPAQVPQVVKLSAESGLRPNPITGRDMAATGAMRHGAAFYLHHRFYEDGMPLERAKLLAYCVAAEVAEFDNSVGKPIDMVVITPHGSEPVVDPKRYEEARGELIGAVRSLLAGFR